MYTHTHIQHCCHLVLQERKLDVFFEMEDKMISKSSLDKKTVLDILSDPTGEPSQPRVFVGIAALYGVLTTRACRDCSAVRSPNHACL